MNNETATISVSQEEANAAFVQHVTGPVDFNGLKHILGQVFPGINANQCSGIIHRAHTKDNAVLEKVGKLYRLREKGDSSAAGSVPASASTASTSTAAGLEQVRAIIIQALADIRNIPIGAFGTAEDFTMFQTIQQKLEDAAASAAPSS